MVQTRSKTAAALALANNNANNAPNAAANTLPVNGIAAAPINAAPINAATVNAAPANAAPVNVAPVNVAPINAAPVNPAPLNVAPVNAAPVNAAPVNAAPVNAAPVNAAPVNAAPANAAPPIAAPANTAATNTAATNTAATNAAAANAAAANATIVLNAASTPAPLPATAVQKRPSDSAGSDISPKRTRHDPPEGSDEEVDQLDNEQIAPARRKRPADDGDDDDVNASAPRRATQQDRIPIPPIKLAPRQSKRPKLATAADESYVSNSIAQFTKLKPAKSSLRKRHTSTILKILPKMSLPSEDQIQMSIGGPGGDERDEIAAYSLNASEAKALLSSNRPITVPVFVSGGARTVFNGLPDSRRPIEQALSDWFINPRERFAYPNTKKKISNYIEGQVTAEELRQHCFDPENNTLLYPWNLPDIINPLGSRAVPEFLLSDQCRFLDDLMRMIIVPYEEDVCLPGCPSSGQLCKEHTITLSELTLLNLMYEHWKGTLMIADPGAITLSHFDKWSLGTWISCYEGEIGLCWLDRPSDNERMACVNDETKIPTSPLLKVLRAGDAVYMPPGTVHIVWRLSEGGQTLGMAGHVLRRDHVDSWLEMLQREMANKMQRNDAEAYGTVVPPLVRAVKSLIESLRDKADIERLGGARKLASAMETIKALEAQIVALAASQPGAKAQDGTNDAGNSESDADAAGEQDTDNLGLTDTVSGAEGTQSQAGSQPVTGEATL
ncbi:unnamed protein product [Zymoseptoria tritici ST99CH_1A5]|uniref:JmjC domain-containing protein n=1 Tax=Zymoseptoria tritici ST99CH_1A5 TaxID=1276529 RepID=A0A1Y6LXJ3_ZYMTR|nr:unnamed protein product [Zymoseptoria tritici ST99CH_1A5]